MRNVITMKAKPSSHTPRLSAWVSRLRCIDDDSGASSTPMRWRMLASALDRALATARM